MAKIDVQTIVLEEGVFTLGSNDYSIPVTSCTLTPSGGSVLRAKGIGGIRQARLTKDDWSIALDVLQDVLTENSLTNYTFDHEGEIEEYTFTPVDGGPSYTGHVVLRPTVIGGSSEGILSASVTFECVEKPTKVAPTP
ncbi:hypothetical protein GCM10027515_26580 [Schumannella luteola]|uniref:Phage tail protein n=1 Tax=Schumannella luteola TaxID=472059 RepID=A0A852YQN8_9MICO|nr:hypothetical protein [Schumannella luteola]NYG99545.1 hypothetical protein [Schumannella luteola]TPX03862.1 hypothetical protein FJ656_15130 [Schumannella luteola]